jgi:hypothetical protein
MFIPLVPDPLQTPESHDTHGVVASVDSQRADPVRLAVEPRRLEREVDFDRLRQQWFDAQEEWLLAERTLLEFELALAAKTSFEKEVLKRGAALRDARELAYAQSAELDTQLEAARRARLVHQH